VGLCGHHEERPAGARTEAQREGRAEPLLHLREPISHLLFVRQAALGEWGRAQRHYEELVALLEEQLGTPPAPESRALYQRLRAGEEI